MLSSARQCALRQVCGAASMTTTALTPRALEYIKAAQAVLAKTDGRDKLVATLQYAAMFAAAGSPGALLNAQKSLSNARKPFRAMKARALRPRAAPPSVFPRS